MNEPFDVKTAINVQIASPKSESPRSPNMNRFAVVQPAATAAPATTMPTVPRKNCQLWLVATTLPQGTIFGGPPTRPITTGPGAMPKMNIPSAPDASERKLEKEMEPDGAERKD